MVDAEVSARRRARTLRWVDACSIDSTPVPNGRRLSPIAWISLACGVVWPASARHVWCGCVSCPRLLRLLRWIRWARWWSLVVLGACRVVLSVVACVSGVGLEHAALDQCLCAARSHIA